jgi:hypothetical protein
LGERRWNGFSLLSSLSSDSSSGGMGAERGRSNGDWEVGEKKAGGGDWNRIGGKVREITTSVLPF